MTRIRDWLIVIRTGIGRSFILGGHDSIDEKDAGDELENEDSGPSKEIGMFDMAIELHFMILTSRLEVSSSTRCSFI